MNKRIKELAEEAGIHDDVCSMCPIHESEKFAELIVRECALLCSDPVVILQHFGIDSKSE